MAGTVWDRLLKLEEAVARRRGETYNALLGPRGSPGFWRREGADAAVAPVREKGPRPVPPVAPPDVSLEDNIREAKRLHDPLWFYNQVKPGGPWDYKRKSPLHPSPYADFGNFHYGAVGRAAGFPSPILERLAGWNQVNGPNSDPRFGSPLGGYPYGDDPRDQTMIDAGIRYQDNR